ncbi:MAG TPA: TIGR03067 domain-containing protein [Rhodanobacteraceae bacterium]|nr:TIGR03067 domain-containing protein [Rhodanobacteraceae bacterium]
MSDPTRDDLAALQGCWKQTGLEADGVVDPPDEVGGTDAVTTISGMHFTVRAPGGTLLLEGRFTLDATTTPKSITWIDSMGEDAGRPLPAIYRLDGERFVFIAAGTGMPRPTRFRTERGQTLRRFVRA